MTPKPVVGQLDSVRLRHAESVTAMAAELIKTSTPVAYAPACASTFALKMIVTANAIAV